MEFEITWTITETTTYRGTFAAEDLGLRADADLTDVQRALGDDPDALAGFEGSEREINFDNSEGRVITAINTGVATEPWCNHDPVAVVNGVCECGTRVG